jgi:hypothetical protein
MRDAAFFISLGEDRRILVMRSTSEGRYHSFAVGLMIFTGGKWVDAGRFDTAHELPHRDVLG